MTKEPENYRFVITGGPGTGKTSLIMQLSRLGYKTFGENARKILGSSGCQAPIHSNQPDKQFFKRILETRLTQYEMAPAGKISFYDRGIPDSLGFFKYMGIDPPGALVQAINRKPYNKNIFILPPWEEIYSQDYIRKESFIESCKIHLLLSETYRTLGYELIEVPRMSLEKRSDFVLLQIHKHY